MDYQHWLQKAVAQLVDSESPRRDAEILLGFVTGKARTFILAFGETLLSDEQILTLDGLLAKRTVGEPIAYITGEREFWSLPLLVSPATLIPRPDTECVVEQTLLRLPNSPCRILDLGTGTGAIALALAFERPDCKVLAVDNVPQAVELARCNAQRLAMKNIEILQSDWFSALGNEKFALIVSNPPYIDGNDTHLQQGDVRFEPRSALVASECGFADIKTLISDARAHLVSGGWLVIEHGWQQAAAVRALFNDAGYQLVETGIDYGGNERLTMGQFNRRSA